MHQRVLTVRGWGRAVFTLGGTRTCESGRDKATGCIGAQLRALRHCARDDRNGRRSVHEMLQPLSFADRASHAQDCAPFDQASNECVVTNVRELIANDPPKDRADAQVSEVLHEQVLHVLGPD